MAAAGNLEQVEYWNGVAGERWARNQVALDRALGPFGRAALDRLAPVPGERLLDVGCGAGGTLLELAARLGGTGEVLGADISRPLLEHARRRLAAAQVSGIDVLEADVAEARFERPFDAIFSRFGVMFFADPVAAFVNLRQALVPGGRLGFACWQRLENNAWSAVPLAALRALVADAPAPQAVGAPGPFAFADPERVRAVLSGAGFSQVVIEPFHAPVVMSEQGIEDGVDFALRVGPAARWVAEQSEAVKTSVRARIASALAPALVGTTVALDGASWTVSARA
jgi:SAM-dependent methyltransferase